MHESHFIFKLIAYLLLIVFIFGPGLVAFYRNVCFECFHDKTLVYFCAELSFLSETSLKKKWSDCYLNLKDYLQNNRSTKLTISIKGIYNGTIGFYFESISKIASIWWTIFIVFITTLAIILKSFSLKGNQFLPEIIILLSIIFSWFVYYLRSFSSDNAALISRAMITFSLLKQLNFHVLRTNFIDHLIKEVSLDFDLYKNKTGAVDILLMLISGGIVLYIQSMQKLSSGSLIFVFTIIFSMMFFKGLYETYRGKIVYIALNALIELKKDLESNKPLQRTGVTAGR